MWGSASAWGSSNTVIDSVQVKSVSKGSRGKSVTILQEALLEIGRGLNIKNSGGADGSFGSGTEKDVKEFQAIMGLTQDGIVGSRTWEALANAQNAQRDNAFPPQELVAYTITGSAIPSSGSITPASPTTSVAPIKRTFPKWVVPLSVGLVVLGLISAVLLRRRKGKRK